MYAGSVPPLKAMAKILRNAQERKLKTAGPEIRRKLYEIVHVVFLTCKSLHFDRCPKPTMGFPPHAVAPMLKIETFSTPLMEDSRATYNTPTITAGLSKLCARTSESSIRPTLTKPPHKIRRACVFLQDTADGLWCILLESSKKRKHKTKHTF
jgi:hypothetical protein